MPVCLCVSGCVHVTDWRLAGVLMRPVCQYIITSVWAPPSPATFLHCSHAPLSTNPRNLRSATGGKLYTCTLDTEKNCIQAPGHSRLLSILTHTSGPGREGDMGQWNTTTPSLVAKQSMDPSSSCPSPLQPVSRRTGGRKCSADQQQVCLLSSVYRQCNGW